MIILNYVLSVSLSCAILPAINGKLVKRQHFSMVFDSLNNRIVCAIRNTFIVDKMKWPY